MLKIQPPICTSLQPRNLGELTRMLGKARFAEVRLDRLFLSKPEIEKIFSNGSKLIVTCRPGVLRPKERIRMLVQAVEAGAAYVDIELEMPKDHKRTVIKAARRNGAKVIVSYHNFQKVPKLEILRRKISACFKCGADLAKIACHVNALEENYQILSLLQKNRKIIALGMGKLGRATRVLAPILGSPFTYAALESGRETAPGQLTFVELNGVYSRLVRGQPIAFIGFMGAGKTTSAAEFSRLTKCKVIELDSEIEKFTGKRISEIFFSDGEQAFRKIESKLLRKFTTEKWTVISCGGGAVLRAENRKILKSRCTAIWLQAPFETIVKRLRGDRSRPLLLKNRKPAELKKLFNSRVGYYKSTAKLTINSDELTPSQIADKVFDEIYLTQ